MGEHLRRHLAWYVLGTLAALCIAVVVSSALLLHRFDRIEAMLAR